MTLTYKPSEVVLMDGTPALSDSSAWAHDCLMRFYLRLPFAVREEKITASIKILRPDGADRLRKMISDAEPFYVANLATRDERLAYVDSVGYACGWKAKEILQEKVRKIWQDRKSKVNAP